MLKKCRLLCYYVDIKLYSINDQNIHVSSLGLHVVGECKQTQNPQKIHFAEKCIAHE